MRPELEKIKYIEDYLSGNLTSQEKADFETKMNQDAEFAREVEMQRILIERVKIVAIKQEIQAAHQRFKHNTWFTPRNKWLLGGGIILSVALIAFITFTLIMRHEYSMPEFSGGKFINPPVPSADVPYLSRTINANKGGVITYKSGSKIFIPPNAFLDSTGNVINGKVIVQYREFNDPFDIYLAGIPMNVAVNRRTYTMESASMCEINATYKGRAVQVNPDSPVSIFQSSYTTSTAFDRYYLDTIQKRWIYKGKDNPINTNEFDLDRENRSYYASKPVRPIKPRKADPYQPRFTVSVDVKHFPEMAGFKDVIFEIDKDENRFKDEDTYVVWDDIKIKKGPKTGTYAMTFTSELSGKKAEYVVWPVFEGASYDQAMKLYNKKMAQYEKGLAARKQKEQERRDAMAAKERRIDSINKAIEKRNRVIIARNRYNDSVYQSRLKYNQVVQQQKTLSKSTLEETVKDTLPSYNQALNYKRVEILNYRLLNENQLAMLRSLKKEELYRHADLINSTYADFNVFIDLKNKIRIMLSSSRISQSVKKELSYMKRRQILARRDKIYRMYDLIYKEGNDLYASSNIFREFEIDGFGIWNIDVLGKMKAPGDKKIQADFVDAYTNVYLSEVTYIDGGRKRLVRLPQSSFRYFTYNTEKPCLVWQITDKQDILYFNDFENIPDTRSYTFEMQTLENTDGKFDSYKTIKEALVGLMKKE